MLMALALLAAIDASASPRVDLTLTGTSGTPVSATPRRLSDVARELREGRKAVGGFSAVETTVRPGPGIELRFIDSEEDSGQAGPEVVPEPPPAYVTTYAPTTGGGARHRALRRRPASQLAAPGPGSRPAFRPSVPPGYAPRPMALGRSRQRPG
jgi:hypothetical protein